MDDNEALQVFDGCMLGDSSLSKALLAGDPRDKCYGVKNSRFHISQSSGRYDHSDWMYYVKDALISLGVGVSSYFPKAGTRTSRGKEFKFCDLVSLTSPLLTIQRVRWYPCGTKEVPEDFIFTPISLANAWMSDGSVIDLVGHRHLSELSTPGFNLRSIEVIEQALRNIGIVDTGRARREVGSSGIIVTIRQDSSASLAALIRPWLLPSFRYKIKDIGSLRIGEENRGQASSGVTDTVIR